MKYQMLEVLDYVKEVSKASKEVSGQDLSSRIIKLQEEVGELGKEYLALQKYVGAYDSSGEASRENVLYEAVDCLVVVLDIINQLGFEDSYLTNALIDETRKWADKLPEEKTKDIKIPFKGVPFSAEVGEMMMTMVQGRDLSGYKDLPLNRFLQLTYAAYLVSYIPVCEKFTQDIKDRQLNTVLEIVGETKLDSAASGDINV